MTNQQYGLAAFDHCRFLQRSLAGGIDLQMDQTTPAHQEDSWQQQERSQDANLMRRVHCMLIAIIKKDLELSASL